MAGNRTSGTGGRRRAFTLIELLVVIGVICLLAGLVLGAVAGAKQAAQKARTKAALAVIEMACERFKQDHQSQPWAKPASIGPGTTVDPDEVYAELHNLPGATINRTTDYLSGMPANMVKQVGNRSRLQDSWGSDLVFRLDPATLKVVVWSRGPNRVDETNFEDPPAAYAGNPPPPPPAAYSNPAAFPRSYYYLGNGHSRGDDLGNL